MDLELLKTDLSWMTEEEVEAEGFRLYEQEFFPDGGNRGEIRLHDGQTAFIFRDRFEHAFRTSPDRIRHPYSKSKTAHERIERIKWITPILAGKVEGTQCWLVPDRRRKRRLYVVVQEQYIIWLEERKDGGWKFSTAYCAGKQDIQRYTNGSVKLWEI